MGWMRRGIEGLVVKKNEVILGALVSWSATVCPTGCGRPNRIGSWAFAVLLVSFFIAPMTLEEGRSVRFRDGPTPSIITAKMDLVRTGINPKTRDWLTVNVAPLLLGPKSIFTPPSFTDSAT